MLFDFVVAGKKGFLSWVLQGWIFLSSSLSVVGCKRTPWARSGDGALVLLPLLTHVRPEQIPGPLENGGVETCSPAVAAENHRGCEQCVGH